MMVPNQSVMSFTWYQNFRQNDIAISIRKSPWTLSPGMSQTCRTEILNPLTYKNFWLSPHLNWIFKKYRKIHQTIEKWWFFNKGYKKAEAACCARCPPVKKITLRGEALRVIPSGSPWDLEAGSRPEVSTYSKYRPGEILSYAPGAFVKCTRCPGTISIIFGSPSFPKQFWD